MLLANPILLDPSSLHRLATIVPQSLDWLTLFKSDPMTAFQGRLDVVGAGLTFCLRKSGEGIASPDFSDVLLGERMRGCAVRHRESHGGDWMVVEGCFAQDAHGDWWTARKGNV